MAMVEVRALTEPVGLMRILATVLTCVSLSLAASAGPETSSYWAWCMFSWCFCFLFSLLIVILEFTRLSGKVPISWDDFTTAFAMLASLMCFAVSIIYPTFYARKTRHLQIAASVVSWFSFGAYAGEVVLTYIRPGGQISGYLSTVPGLLKMLETFVACIIFTSLAPDQYSRSPELQWCVAVFSLCFIFSLVIILLTLAHLLSYSPVAFDKVTTAYNILAALMYLSAMVLWPLYTLKNSKKPSNCGQYCAWDKLLVVTFMTIANFIVYTADSVYSIYLLFFTGDR